MRHSRSHDAIHAPADTIMARETRRCLVALAALIGAFTLVLSVVVR